MARADLFDTSPDRIQPWMEAVSEILDGTILFVTHPTDGGDADAGPIIRLSPTQVIAYQLFNTARHTDADAQEGDAASNILIRAVAIDFDGEPETLTTISGSPGTPQFDTNMQYLTDNFPAGEAGLSVGYGGAGTTTTNNALPGILEVPIVLQSFGATPVGIVELHTHVDNTQGDTIGRNALSTQTISFAGSIGSASHILFRLDSWSFFPMIHTAPASLKWIYVTGDTVDADSADSPRFGLATLTGHTGTFDVDCRSVTVS